MTTDSKSTHEDALAYLDRELAIFEQKLLTYETQHVMRERYNAELSRKNIDVYSRTIEDWNEEIENTVAHTADIKQKCESIASQVDEIEDFAKKTKHMKDSIAKALQKAERELYFLIKQ